MKIYVLSALESGIDSINILKKHLELSGVIGLSERPPADNISGYKYFKKYCDDNSVDFFEVQDYSLACPEDRDRLLGLDIDVLIVAGWQRLIPGWLIKHCKICVIGSHGSVNGITGGRGRSPQNWALMLGKKEFFISIFKIDKGIDSGAVIDTKKYVISDLDDIRTSYAKVSWLTSHMIVECVKDGRLNAGNFLNQEGVARYLPQRLPEHGEIDWSRNSREIYDFIRSLTRPYPGAFSYIGGDKIIIWKGIPFEIRDYSDKFKPGEIANIYANGDFLVRTGDSLVLVEDYSGEPDGRGFILKEGLALSSGDFKKQIADIIDRHKRKYPDLVISDDIAALGDV